MIKIYFILFIIFLALIILFKNKLSKKALISLMSFFVLIIIFIIFYEIRSKNINQNYEALLLSFNTGNSIKCKNILVNNQKFNYDYGTKSFVSKSKIPLIISIKECNNE